MTEPAVLILAEDADDYLPSLTGLLRQGVEVATASDSASVLAAWSGQEVLLAQPDLAAAVLKDLPGIHWVQSTWAGVEPLLGAGRRDYLLTGVRDVFGPMMSEYVFGYLLAHELRMTARRQHQKSRRWWPEDSGSLNGKVLGVMGTGSIGRHIAGTGVSFGLRVLGYSRSGRPVDGFERVYSPSQLFEFLPRLDYLVAVLPRTRETDGLLDARAFGAMRPSCVLVNVGRGNAVNQAALGAALRQGQLAGAVLDVFGDEPLPADSPLWDAPGCTVTAHVAARSRPEDIARIFVENYNRYVAGEALNYLVDFERGY